MLIGENVEEMFFKLVFALCVFYKNFAVHSSFHTLTFSNSFRNLVINLSFF